MKKRQASLILPWPSGNVFYSIQEIVSLIQRPRTFQEIHH